MSGVDQNLLRMDDALRQMHEHVHAALTLAQRPISGFGLYDHGLPDLANQLWLVEAAIEKHQRLQEEKTARARAQRQRSTERSEP